MLGGRIISAVLDAGYPCAVPTSACLSRREKQKRNGRGWWGEREGCGRMGKESRVLCVSHIVWVVVREEEIWRCCVLRTSQVREDCVSQ